MCDRGGELLFLLVSTPVFEPIPLFGTRDQKVENKVENVYINLKKFN